MNAVLERLYPPPMVGVPLYGTYLASSLRDLEWVQHVFVYANFITSLDGRISLPDPQTGRRAVPAALSNPRDWRLYMELLAQADVLITTARHLRAVAAGRHGNLLRVAEREFPDLVAWRRARGLMPHPACAVVSLSLDLPIDAICACHDGPIEVVTTTAASAERIAALAERVPVSLAGDGTRVDGRALVNALASRGHRFIYSIGGPRIFHTLLAAEVIDRLYLTTGLTILAGEQYDTLVHGSTLAPPTRFTLNSLHLDRDETRSQLFACLDRAHLGTSSQRAPGAQR